MDGETESGSSQEPVLSLTQAISKGDRDAFGRFYELWFDRMFAMARRITKRDEAFCLDIVQESMLRVIKSLPPIDTEERLRYWLARTVHSTAIDGLRKESAIKERERKTASWTKTEGPENANENFDRIAWIGKQLEELSAAEWRLIHERFINDKTLENAGRAAGISGDAAHGRIRKILNKWRKAAREVFDETI